MHSLAYSYPQSSLAFSYERWEPQLPALSRRYRENRPYPHILLPDFLDAGTARFGAIQFPRPGTDLWTHYKHANENKLGLSKRELFPEWIDRIFDELNSRRFVNWLSALTGIEQLLPDPVLEGGGIHQSVRGGFLNLHTDFSHHHYNKNWRRRLNLILYLNEHWQEQWGGAIELWDSKMSSCVAEYPPLFNHALIFQTDENSFHGFPEPLRCPANESRKSLALYYYTVDNSPARVRSTDYRPRPGDGVAKSAVIWLDRQAVHLYSKAKSRLGFSDKLASKILKILSRDKN